MGLLDAYQDSTDKVAEVMAARPVEPEPAKPKHSAWSVIPRALGAAGAEVVGNVSDVLDAFGQTAAAAGGMGPGIRPDSQKRTEQSAEAFQKLKVEGLDFRGEDSRQVYNFARDLRPDPITAGNAENIVFGLTKGLAKAVGSAATLGPVGGAFAFGGSEGMTAAEDLAVQGVDKATRTKVGAVTAAMNTAGVLLPVTGSTLATTATLVVVGGALVGVLVFKEELSSMQYLGIALAIARDLGLATEGAAEVLTGDGWYHTGDAGFLDAGGHLKIIDRAKDVGKLSNGAMFAPNYIENKLKFFQHVKEAVCFGHDRDMVCAFINIDVSAVGNWAERRGIAYSGYADLAGKPEVLELLRECVEQVNADLVHDTMVADSQIHRFLVLHKELDPDDDELTRTRKVRRNFVAEKYKVLIDALYAGKANQFIETEVKFEDGRRGKVSADLRIIDAKTFPIVKKAA